MSTHSLLLAPSANRVYASTEHEVAAAELVLTLPSAREVRTTTIAGVEHLAFDVDALDATALATLASQSAAFALFAHEGELLRPVALPRTSTLDADLVTIPKYQGKTNEMFTRALLNVTLSQVATGRDAPLDVLDPLAGRGTTLFTAWLAGHHAFGVEADTKAFEAMAAYVKTWLRRKRLKHSADVTPVRRDGKSIGRRFDVTVRPADAPELHLTAFTGAAEDSAALYGKKRFDAIITDAPYGVVHGATSKGRRERSPEHLLAETLPVWAGQLRPGGALGLSWNTLTLPRERLVALVEAAGLAVCDADPWDRFSHRVDSSIVRDLLVATTPRKD